MKDDRDPFWDVSDTLVVGILVVFGLLGMALLAWIIWWCS